VGLGLGWVGVSEVDGDWGGRTQGLRAYIGIGR
jgi:hypothetical protein